MNASTGNEAAVSIVLSAGCGEVAFFWPLMKREARTKCGLSILGRSSTFEDSLLNALVTSDRFIGARILAVKCAKCIRIVELPSAPGRSSDAVHFLSDFKNLLGRAWLDIGDPGTSILVKFGTC